MLRNWFHCIYYKFYHWRFPFYPRTTLRLQYIFLIKDDLCNGFGVAGNNMTTPEPVTMTTTNKTMHCFYGFHHNGSTEHAWQREECAPQVSTSKELIWRKSVKHMYIVIHRENWKFMIYVKRCWLLSHHFS